MPKPDGTLEHSFDKNTVSAAANVKQTIGTNSLKGGVNAEYQHNRSGGWSFVLPDFELLQFGIFLSDHFAVNDNIILSTGIRFDYGSISTHSYHDWFKTPTASGDSIYAERSANSAQSIQQRDMVSVHRQPYRQSCSESQHREKLQNAYS